MTCSLCTTSSWISTPHCTVSFNPQNNTSSVIPKKHAYHFDLLSPEEKADMKYCVGVLKRLYAETVGSFRDATYVSKEGHLYYAIYPSKVQSSSLQEKWQELAGNWYDTYKPDEKRLGKL